MGSGITEQASLQPMSLGVLEQKDSEELPLVYLANDVRDVVVVDPKQSVFMHSHLGRTRSIQQLPQALDLECG